MERDGRVQLRIAGAQLAAGGDLYANQKRIMDAIDWAADADAQLLLTPECALNGDIESSDGQITAVLDELVQYASAADIGIAMGIIKQETGGLTYNELRLYGQNGRLLGWQAKTLADRPDAQGSDYTCERATLRQFSFNGIPIGMLLGNDMFANPLYCEPDRPNLPARLKRMGAKLILHANNSPAADDAFGARVLLPYCESMLNLHAKACGVHILTANRAQPEDVFGACPSGILAPDGQWIVRAALKGTQTFIETIDFQL